MATIHLEFLLDDGGGRAEKKNVMRSKSPDQIVHGCCNGFGRLNKK